MRTIFERRSTQAGLVLAVLLLPLVLQPLGHHWVRVADVSLLGQHALAYVLASYGAAYLSRRILWFPLLQQALHVLPLLLLVQLVQFGVRVMPGASLPGLDYFIGPLVGVCLWWPLTFILLLPQYQPVSRDANRPI